MIGRLDGPLGDQLRWEFGDEKPYPGDGLTDVLLPVNTKACHRVWKKCPYVESATYIVTLGKAKIVKHVIRDGIGDVVSVNVEGSEHDAGPDLIQVRVSPWTTLGTRTMIFQSILRRTALSSLHVHRNKGSKAARFSHFG